MRKSDLHDWHIVLAQEEQIWHAYCMIEGQYAWKTIKRFWTQKKRRDIKAKDA